MSKLDWPDMTFPPINLWNAWKLKERMPEKVDNNKKEDSTVMVLNPKIKILMRIINDRYHF